MSEFTIYTETDRPGSADVPPFIVGDSTAWAIRFERPDGTTYVPSSISMRVGHINGLADGTYASAFIWHDRCDNKHIASITVDSGVPAVTWNTAPVGAMVGSDGVYIVRGQIPDGKVYDFQANARLLTLRTGETLASNITNVTFSSEGRTVATGRVEWTLAEYDIKLVITDPGSGYDTDPSVVFTGGGGTGMAATAIRNEYGGVQALRLTSLGNGYTSAPIVSFTGGTPDTTAAAAAEYVSTQAGQLRLAKVTNTGSGYTHAPIVTLENENNGSGGEIAASGFDTVSEIKITNEGTGYVSPVAVTLTGGAGSGATAASIDTGQVGRVIAAVQANNIPAPWYVSGADTYEQTLSFGSASFIVVWRKEYAFYNFVHAVSSIRVVNPGSSYTSSPTLNAKGYTFTGILRPANVVVTNPGSGYTVNNPPTVTFTGSGGSGTGMTGVAVVGKITTLEITSAGSGYSLAPTLAITDGGGTGAKGTATIYDNAASYRIILTEVTSTTRGAKSTPAIVGTVTINKGTTVSRTVPINDFIASINAGVEFAETPYKRAESSAAIVGAVRLTSHSDGRYDEDGSLQYDHSALVVLPRTIATANLTTGTDSSGNPAAVGTLNPINAHVTARLAMRRTTTLDIQVFGDGRMLFQGSLAVVQKIT